MRHQPFADLPPTPAEHFKLAFFAAISHVLKRVIASFESPDTALAQFPFLAGYRDELAVRGVPEPAPPAWWRAALQAWEKPANVHLPLYALRDAAGLDQIAMTLLLTIGLIEEDARFGGVFEALHGIAGQRRPTLGLLHAWWSEAGDDGGRRAIVRRLQELGLVHVVNSDAPRSEWALQVPGLLWDAMRGEQPEAPAPWLRYRPPVPLPTLAELHLPDQLGQTIARLPSLLDSHEVRTLVVRGPERNGRRTLLSGVAKSSGRGLLEVAAFGKPDDERWRLIGPLATLLHAMPAIVVDIPPGETAVLPALDGYRGPVGIVLGKHGGLRGGGVEQAVTIHMPIPDGDARRQHWRRNVGRYAVRELDWIGDRFRVTSGNIHRAAGLACSHAALDGRDFIAPADVQHACRTLNRQTLDTLATHVPTTGNWSQLAVDAETRSDLANLESRCRHRERLRGAVGAGAHVNVGVRALFSGPS